MPVVRILGCFSRSVPGHVVERRLRSSATHACGFSVARIGTRVRGFLVPRRGHLGVLYLLVCNDPVLTRACRGARLEFVPRGTKLRTVMPWVFLRPLLFLVLHGSHRGLLFGFVYSARLITRLHMCNVGVSSSCVWMPWSVTWCLYGHATGWCICAVNEAILGQSEIMCDYG